MPSPAPVLSSTVRTAGGRTTVVLRGDLDVATATQLAGLLLDVATGAPACVVVDLSGVTFVDATGLGALVRGRKAVARRGGVLLLANPSRMVRRMLGLLDLEQVLPVEP